MNIKEFSKSLRKGLGSALIELQNANDKTAYREIVLRCCLCNITVNQQMAGTKGKYLYNAICELGEPDYHNFEQIIIEKFLSRCNNGLLAQLLDILDCYWYDGSQDAKNAIHVKYDCFAAKKGRLIKSGGIDEICFDKEFLRGMA